MEKTLKKTALVISVVLALLLVIAYVVYDYLLLAPNISLAYQGSIGQQKLDAEFKVIVELESLAYLSREYMVNLEIVSGTEIKTTLPAQIKILESRKKQTAEFTCMLSEPVIPGSYSAVVYITAKKSIFSGTYSRIVELRQDFIIAEKIISGVINFIDIKGGKKLGEVMGINAVAKNTGEAAKVFSVEGEIVNPKGETAQLPAMDFKLNIEESKIMAYDYNIPLEAPGGKYKVRLKLYVGETNDKSRKLLAEQEFEKNISERIVKAIVETVKVRGKLKSGEAAGFDVFVKNTGDIQKLFSVDASLLDPSGKNISLPAKEMQIAVGETKKYPYEYLIPQENSHGLYKINIIVNAGALKEPGRKKVTEAQQAFSVAERITRAAISKIAVASVSGTKIKVGEAAAITVEIKNTGEIEHNFPVVVIVRGGTSPIKLKANMLALGVGEIKQIVFEALIPLNGNGGNYEARIGVYNSLDTAETPVELYEEKNYSFPVAGPIISGSVSLTGTLGKFGYGDSVSIKAKFSNTGEVSHIYFIKLEVLDPVKKVSTILNEKVELKKIGEIEKSGEFKVDPAVLDGKYTVLASIWDRLGDDGNPSGKLGEDSKVFEIIDTEPVINNVIGVAPVIGRATTIVATVKDDRELKTVMLVYMGPGMSEVAKEIMIRTSGNKKEGSYSAQTRRFNFAGSLNYYIEATDSKGQKSKSQEYKTQIK